MTSQNQKIHIVTQSYFQAHLKNFDEENSCAFFLSKDYSLFVSLNNQVHPHIKLKNLGVLFHQKIEQIQSDFLEFSHQINHRISDDFFWGTQLASRNSAGIDLLYQSVSILCSLDIVNQKSDQQNLIFITENYCTGKILYSELCRSKKNVDFNFTLRDRLKFLKCFTWPIAQSIFFLAVFFWRWLNFLFISTPLISSNNVGKRNLIRSWITKGPDGSSNQYIDRNFGKLLTIFQKEKIETWILPQFFNLDTSHIRKCRELIKTKENFIFLEKYLNPFDSIKMLFANIKILFLDFGPCRLHDIDLSLLVRYLHFQSALSPHLLYMNLVYPLFRQFEKKHIFFNEAIYPMENNPVEKIFIKGLKKFLPETKITGFQHSVWYKEQLGMFLNPQEKLYHPLPHKILTKGRIYKDILCQSGLPEDIIFCGQNLRFTEVNKYQPSACFARKTILVILNYDINQSMEILFKLLQSLKTIPFDDILIKSHPLTDIEQLRSYLTEISFPEYQFASGPIAPLVLKSHAVVMTFGSISNLEVIILGVPLIRISLDSNFNFDPLWSDYELFDTAKNANELTKNLKTALNLSITEKEGLQHFARKIKLDYFEFASEEKIKYSFIEKN